MVTNRAKTQADLARALQEGREKDAQASWLNSKPSRLLNWLWLRTAPGVALRLSPRPVQPSSRRRTGWRT
ncbi:hypothetical protein ACFSC4_31315 [Deinococcus malanensis]